MSSFEEYSAKLATQHQFRGVGSSFEIFPDKFSDEYQLALREVLAQYKPSEEIQPTRCDLERLDLPLISGSFSVSDLNRDYRPYRILGRITLSSRSYQLAFKGSDIGFSDLFSSSTREWRDWIYSKTGAYFRELNNQVDNENLNQTCGFSAFYSLDDPYGKKQPLVENTFINLLFDGDHPTDALLVTGQEFYTFKRPNRRLDSYQFKLKVS